MLGNGDNFTVLMHDYQFTVSLPNTSIPPPAPAEPVEAPVKKVGAFDWMDEDEEEAPKSTKSSETVVAPFNASVAPTVAPTKQKPLCKYGNTCYQKNPEHHAKYFHPHLEKKAIEKTPIAPAPVPAPSTSSTTPPPSSVPLTSSAPSSSATDPSVAQKDNTSAAPSPDAPRLSKDPSKIEEAPFNEFGKRPKPATDLMDEEEEFLPKSKKSKFHGSASAAANKANGKSGAFDMSWMVVEEETASKPLEDTAVRSKTPSPPPVAPAVPVEEKLATQPKETSFGAEVMEESVEASKPVSAPKPDSRPPISAIPSSSQPKSSTSTPPASQSFTPSASQPKSQKSTSSSKSDIKSSVAGKSIVQVESIAEMREIVSKKTEDAYKILSSSPGTRATRTVVLLPYLIYTSFIQESLDIMIEGVSEYGQEEQGKLQALLEASGLDHQLETLTTRFWYAPPAPSHAAAFRRRVLTSGEVDEESGLLPLDAFLKMAPPALSLADVFKHIVKEEGKFDEEYNAENGSGSSQEGSHSFNLVIVNESNWRFKGIGVRTSMSPQVFAAVDAALKIVPSSHQESKTTATSLQALTKQSVEVGEPGKAFPVRLPKLVAPPPNTHLDLPLNTTMIVHIVAPGFLDQDAGMPEDVAARWKGCIWSALSSI